MKLSESVFAPDGKPLGWIEQDSLTGVIGFKPREGVPIPPGFPWRNVNELLDALRRLYGPPAPAAHRRA